MCEYARSVSCNDYSGHGLFIGVLGCVRARVSASACTVSMCFDLSSAWDRRFRNIMVSRSCAPYDGEINMRCVGCTVNAFSVGGRREKGPAEAAVGKTSQPGPNPHDPFAAGSAQSDVHIVIMDGFI